MVIHDVGAKHPEHSIVAIENGHVTGRKVGDGASHVVLEQVRQADAQPSDHLSYLTKTPDGKILKSSTMYIRGRNGKVVAILGINYDISSLLMVEDAVHELIDTKDKTQGEPEKIVNVNDLLDELIAQSVALVGKPVALMNKEDKMRAIGFLMHSVGVMGDERTYDYAVALRAVTTTDFMTAESYNMPWDVLGTVTSRIVNEVKHVNRVFYDCTGKPPATIELE